MKPTIFVQNIDSRRLRAWAALMLGCSLLFGTTGSVRAATRVWDGGGGSDFWGNALNWILDIAPAAGDSLSFPGTPPLLTTNDLAPGFDLGLITFSATGYTARATATGNDIGLTNGITVSHGAGLTRFEIPIKNEAPTLFNVTQAGAELVLDGAIELNQFVSTFDGAGQSSVRGGISGLNAASGVVKNGTGTLLLRVDCTYEGPTLVNTGALHVAALILSPVTANTNTTVMGEGRVNGLTCLGCSLIPGNGGPGRFISDNDFEFNSTATLNVEINGTSPGSGYDQLVANADVTLGNATLAVTLLGGFVPVVGQSFVIVDNTGGNPINGEFTGLPDGASFAVSNSTFRISYSGGDGDDVELTLISIGATGVARTWSGAGANGNWATPANWVGGVAPFPGDDLEFPSGAVRLVNTNNFAAGRTVNRIRITGAGYDLFGNSLSLNAGIFASYAGSSAASFPITLAAAQTITNDSATLQLNGAVGLGGSSLIFHSTGGDTAVNGAISGSGTVRKTGPGGLIYGGAGANTYSTVTFVDGGRLTLSKPAGVNAVRGNLTLGTGVSGTPTVSLTASNQIFDGATVIVNGAGTLDLGGFNEAVNTLSLTGAVVNTGSGLLTVTNRVNATSLGAAAEINGHLALRGGGLREFNIANGPDATDLILNADITTPDGTGLRKTGLGCLELGVASTGPAVVQIDAGAVFQHGTSPLVPITLNGGLLGGFGIAGPVTSAAGGTVAPGTSPGRLNIVGGAWNPATTFAVELNGTNEGVNYDHLFSFNPLNLGGATLDVSLGFTPAPGDTFRLIRGNSVGLSSQFAGLPEGALLTNGATVLRISYTNGAFANNVALTVAGFAPSGVTREWDGDGGNPFWSTPGNWVGNTIPAHGDTVRFSTNAFTANRRATNDLPALTLNRIETAAPGYFLGGLPVDLLEGVFSHEFSVGGGANVNMPLRFLNDGRVVNESNFAASVSINVAGGLDLNGHVVTVSGSGAINLADVTSALGGSLVKTGTNNLFFSGTNQYAGPTRVEAGTLALSGSGEASLTGLVEVVAGRFCGSGRAASVEIDPGGEFFPGGHPIITVFAPGMMTVSNSVRFQPGARHRVLLQSTGLVSRLVCPFVQLNGCDLILEMQPPLTNAAVGDVFTIIENTSTNPIGGTFAGLPEGTVLTASNRFAGLPGREFRISYTGGDGNDVTLTVPVVSAPPSAIQFAGLNSNGLFTLTGAGFSNVTYVIEATTNLNAPIPWLPISTNTSGTNGVYQFIDPGSTNFPLRFYRVKSP
jgi:autotransporter-associated beta strand protein